MDTIPSLEQALALALKLAPKERLQLIEQVASSVENDIDSSLTDKQQSKEHWGKSLNKLFDQLGPIDLVDPEIDDPVEWVRVQREKERKHRLGDWGE
jgi:hypothetical protein